MVSIPKASKDIRPPNYFTPGPCIYEWEKSLPEKKYPVKLAISKRQDQRITDGPGVGAYNTQESSIIGRGFNMGYKPDPYSLQDNFPSPADYAPRISYKNKSKKRQSEEEEESKSQSTRKEKIIPLKVQDTLQETQQIQTLRGPGYYNLFQSSERKYYKLFPQAQRQFLDQSFDSPGPLKYKKELCNEDKSPQYSFGKDKRKFGAEDIIAPGPGSYQLNESVISSRGTIFTKAKLDDVLKPNKRPGPGSYNIQQNLVVTERGIKFTKGKRSFDYNNLTQLPGPQQYQELSLEKYKKRAPMVIMGTSKRVQELSESGPGPGQYNLPSETFNENRHKVYILGKGKEYLDITADRINIPSPQMYSPKLIQPDAPSIKFPRKNREILIDTISIQPGPGEYIKNSIKPIYRFANTKSQRTKVLVNLNPGPGQYDIKGEIQRSVEKAKYKPIKRQLLKEEQTEDEDGSEDDD